MAVFTVAGELADFLQITYTAESEDDLDNAASHLAHAIAIIGVTAFLALLAKVARGKKGGGGGEEAPAKIAPERASPPSSAPKAARSEPLPEGSPSIQPKPSKKSPTELQLDEMYSKTPVANATGYHATLPEIVPLIEAKGFKAGTAPGRLGSGGTYVNNTAEGAIAEFAHHNPGVTPSVLKVEYNPGVNASTNVAPRNYVESFPFNNVDSISAPSVRLPGTMNTNVLNGSVKIIK